MRDSILVKGARANNLKNIDLEIPRDKLVVFTGLSGSGKSSLAFDTIYAEGYRRFVESLSSYARQFLGQMEKPDVDYIEGLSPAISIDQKTTSKNPRSTVGTITEIYDYLRLLWARVGVPHCPVCGKEIRQQTTDQIIDKIMTMPDGTRFQVLCPVIRGKKGTHEKIFDDAAREGYVRARIDGYTYDITEIPELDKNKKHNIEIVVDRLVMRRDIVSRLTDSIETSTKMSGGTVLIERIDADPGDENREVLFSQNYACEEHGISIGELAPRMFSFNNPFGACDACDGIGKKLVISPEKAIPDMSLSLRQGAVKINGYKSFNKGGWGERVISEVGKRHGFTLDMPLCDFSREALHAFLYGTGDEKYDILTSRNSVYTTTFDGMIKGAQRRYEESNNEYYEQFLDEVECPKCHGRKLKDESLSVTVGGLDIDSFCRLSINEAYEFIDSLKFSEMEWVIAREIIKEIKARLSFLQRVGLEYLTLSRGSATLSGGESQRIRLATQIGSSLMGVLYILDEPSIGLHQKDNEKLIETLKRLRDVGNTVIVVEHDEDTMEASDYIVDIGPGAGVHGGYVVAAGTPQEVKANENSITGAYLSGRKRVPMPKTRRKGNGNFLEVKGAYENNLKNVNVKIPLGTFTCVTGVSGSGKSSLVNQIIYKELARRLNRAYTVPGGHKEIVGFESLDKVINIDQSPIGRSPRSNPATYTGLFTDIRTLFAKLPEAKMRGYDAGRFSFNLKGGRCEACQGDGTLKIEMHFLPDVYVTCDVCKGKRYNRETLEVKYKGKNIYEVLDMTVEEGLEFFKNIPSINRKLQTLNDVGLGYIKIGQSSITLSGGEAQRVKLATELAKRSTGKTIYILDEPTTGLHSEDVKRLCSVLQALVDKGNTVLVIEHNLDMIKNADHIIDLGPGGGDKGGNVVAVGTPEEVAKNKNSFTGEFLAKVIERDKGSKTK